MDIYTAAMQLGNWEKIKLLKPENILTHLKDGERVEFTETEMLAVNQKAGDLKIVYENLEWASDEIKPLAEQIEDLEDAGQSAAKLRTYRAALKQYKADIYMPNVTRPKLKTGII